MVAQRGVVVETPIDRPLFVEEPRQLIVGEAGSEERAQLPVVGRRRSGVVEQLVPDEERDPQRSPGIARRRLDPDVVERPLAQDAAVADAVECDPACQTQVPLAGLPVYVTGGREHDLLGDQLNRGGDVHVPLGDRRLRRASRAPEQTVEGG